MFTASVTGNGRCSTHLCLGVRCTAAAFDPAERCGSSSAGSVELSAQSRASSSRCVFRLSSPAASSPTVLTAGNFVVAGLAVANLLCRAKRWQRRCPTACGRSAVPVAPDEKVVGIDLGTTNSLVATMEAGLPRVLPSAEGERSTPSIVAFTSTGELLVGQAAKRQAAINPKNTFHSVKRFIGCQHGERWNPQVPYKIVPHNGKVLLDCPAIGKQLAPEKISSYVLTKLCRDAEACLDAKVSKAVISVPAYFDHRQREATKRAGELADLEVLRIVNEPTMAALAYGLDQRNIATCLVLDLGGGTFDVSLMEVGDGVCEVLATSGNPYLGGDDFDKRIVNWVMGNFREKYGLDLWQDEHALQRLLEACERAKIELSQLQEVRISVPFIVADGDGPKHVDETLTRETFEELCQDLVMLLREPVETVLKDGDIKWKGLTEVVLVGGSCRIPMVEAFARELTNYAAVNSAINPEEVVALGAAVQASMIVGEVTDIMLIDVTPLTLGVETNGGVFSPVVERNTAIPAKATRIFTTSEDAQDSIEVVVLQGERPMAADNTKLGTFRLEGIPPAPEGVPRIEVTFEINRDGMLSVSAKDWATRMKKTITIAGSQDLEENEVQKTLLDADMYFEDDEDSKAAADLVHSAECLIRQTYFHLDDLGERIPRESRESTLDHLHRVQKILKQQKDDEDVTELEIAVKDFRFELMKMGQRVWGHQLAPDRQPGPGMERPAGGVTGGGTSLGAERQAEEREADSSWDPWTETRQV